MSDSEDEMKSQKVLTHFSGVVSLFKNWQIFVIIRILCWFQFTILNNLI